MPKLTIDGIEIEVAPGTTVLQAAEKLGIEIPRFCYHGKLSSPSNCRMCLVEVEKAPRPVPSCSYPCSDNMIVHTDTDGVKKARQAVMELMLINHPLDCPVCDQGGECELQENAMHFGNDRTRYKEPKRQVKEKELGPIIRTVMNRCINCTRCIRFGEEIAGIESLGLLNRGEHAEIGTYISKAINSELSGNFVDVCPVGALTAKPYAHLMRPWELKKTNAIDVTDAVGSNISVHSRGDEVMRILPRMNDDINECWISDKTRFSYDGLKSQRIVKPIIRKDGALQEVSWTEIAAYIKEKAHGNVGAVVGDLVDCEAIIALKAIASDIECRQDGAKFNTENASSYKFNTTIAGLEKADVIVLVGTDPRKEAAMINARIFKSWRKNKTKVAVLGERLNLNYPYEYIGSELASLEKYSQVLSEAKNPVIILGASALRRDDGEAIQSYVQKFAEKNNVIREGWNGYNMLHTAASRVGALKLGCVSDKSIEKILSSNIVYLLGADELDMRKVDKGSFVIFQGTHITNAAQHADVILPSAAYTEKSGIYVNVEGRAQLSLQAVKPYGESKPDWEIVSLVAEALGKKLSYKDINEVRKSLEQADPIFKNIGNVLPDDWKIIAKEGKIESKSLHSAIDNFYLTNAISRASATMHKCAKELAEK